MEDFAGGIDRAINRKPVFGADLEVLRAVSGRGVDRTSALFQRHMFSENAERIAIDKRMPEDRSFKLRARKTGDDLGLAPAEFFADGLEQFKRDDVDIAIDFGGHVLKFRMEGDGDVGRNGPGRS